MDANEMLEKGHLFRLDNGKYKSAESSKGIFHYELPKELENTFSSNGKVMKQKTVNLCTTTLEEAKQRAMDLVAERIREHLTMNSEKEKKEVEMDLIDESLRTLNPEGGSSVSVWSRFVKSKTGEIMAEAMYKRQTVFDAFVEWWGSKSLYDVTESVASDYIRFLEKSVSGPKIWHKMIPLLTEVWSIALPLCKNPWGAFKYDVVRKAVVLSKPTGVGEEWLDKTLEKFVAEYFKQEAASGRKWEKNTAGFVSHLRKHTGVKLVKDVTQRVALDYALKMRNREGTKVARSGRDRISKFKTIWSVMLPGRPNPWDNVSYEDAERAVKYNSMLQDAVPNDMTTSEILRCIYPDIVWRQFEKRHPMTPHRASTVKSIFLRMWEKTAISRPLDINHETAAKYLETVTDDKRSGHQDIDELGLIWWTLFPGMPNPWKFDGDRSQPAERKPHDVVETGEKQTPVADEVPVESNSENTVETTGTEVVEPVVVTVEPEAEKVPEGMTFTEVYELWAKTYAGKYRPQTYYSYKHKVKILSDFCAKRGITRVVKGTVDVNTAREFIKEISSHIAVPVNYISPLKMIWDTAFGTVENPWRAIYDEYTANATQPTEPVTEQPKERKGIIGALKRLVKWLFG